MKGKVSQIGINEIIEHTTKIYTVNTGYIKQVLKFLKRGGILIEHGKKNSLSYSWAGQEEEKTLEILEKQFGAASAEVTRDMQDYLESYGFDSLIDDVSKWIDHENRTIKEYEIDRLWLGRYVDFLDKARQYLKWFKADQSIAKKKYSKLKQKNK